MFQKLESKCFRQVTVPVSKNVAFKKWNLSKMWRSKHGMSWKCEVCETFQKCDIQKIQCFRNVTFIAWNVSETWHSKCEMFQTRDVLFLQKRDLQNIEYIENMTFKTWNILEKWYSKYKILFSTHEMFQNRDVQI